MFVITNNYYQNVYFQFVWIHNFLIYKCIETCEILPNNCLLLLIIIIIIIFIIIIMIIIIVIILI